MDHLQFLFAGFAVFWAAIFVYVLVLQGRVRALEREISRLEERLAESERTPPRGAGDARATARPGPRGAGQSSPTT